MINLTPRLLKTAELITPCKKLADIGTDHAYIPVYALQNDLAETVVASDINEGPLNNAAKTVKQYGFEDRVVLRLSDGLENIEETEADAVVIAGMGGELIAKIIGDAPWLKNNKQIIMQPMTHFEDLRAFLCENGYKITKETVVREGKRLYLALSAEYTEEEADFGEWYFYVGNLIYSNNPDEIEFCNRIVNRLEKKYTALKMSRLSEIYDYIDSFAPFSLQLEWDNSGILVNCGDCVISKALVTLDITAEVLNEAIDGKYDLIVSHHPVIFGSLSALTGKTPAAICFKNGISVISAHTNYDLSPIGVNKVLAQKLNLHNVVSSNDSCFMIGELDKPMPSDMFSEYVSKCLSAHLRYNDCTKEIKTVAVCGGAGSDFASDAKKAGADALVTGDGKYHEFLNATDEEILLVSAGHYETEFPAVVSLCKLLEDKFKDIQFKVAEQKTPIKNI